MKIALHTLGCKLNYAESSAITQSLRNAGHQIMKTGDNADMHIVNSCVVTDVAEKKCKSLIRKLKRKHPGAKIAVVGCFSQLRKDELKTMDQVDLVVGNEHKADLVPLIQNFAAGKSQMVFHSDISKTDSFSPGCSTEGRTRSFVKIQDGCNHRCSFCAIPDARGNSRSATAEQVIQQIKMLDQQGVKEMVLTGVNIGDFGQQHGEDLLYLLQQVDQLLPKARVRLGSVEPELLPDQLVDLIAESSVLMPHFHLPLQAGSNEVLLRMKRKYSTEMFAERVWYVKNKIPHAFISCDIITGFPGETEKQFLDGVQFVESLPLSAMHVFSYSDRSGTPASLMEPKVSSEEIKQRSKQLQVVAVRKRDAFNQRFLGDTRSVLFESGNRLGTISGFTDNYIRVQHPYMVTLENNIVSVKIVKSGINGMMIGEVVQ